jgi:hypothetical protein
MRLNHTPDPESSRTTISFVKDEVKEALIEYCKAHHRLEFDLHTDDRVCVAIYEGRSGYDQDCVQVIIDREGTLEKPVRKKKRSEL